MTGFDRIGCSRRSTGEATVQQGADGAHLAGEIAGSAGVLARPEERAAALLEPLRRVLRFDGAWIALRDDERRGHRSLVSTGWDARTAAYLDGPVLVDEIEQLGLHRSATPLRVADFPVPADALRTWSECLLPAGLHEGLGMSLFATDGRHLGFLGLFTESAESPSDEARDLLATLGPVLALALDPARDLAAAVKAVRGATHAVLLLQDGRTERLPGLPDHEALRPGSPAVLAASALQDGPLTCFLLPLPGDPGAYVTVSVLDVPPDTAQRVRAVVALSPPPDLAGLTRRELDVLGLLVEGRANADVARVLSVTPRTVATHVEHILVKLDADSRTLAAVRAQRRGLYVPLPLLRNGRGAV
jgi:DNA-binding CsgD family transcriptional regulator